MRKYLYLSAVCVCMALCFVGCSKDDDEPGGKGAMYEVTIEQSGDFRSFIKSVVVVANGTRLKDGATGESLASPVILSDEELAVEKVTLSTTGKAIEFAVSGGVVDGEDGVVNEPMQWVVTVYKNGKEIEKKSLVFRDGKEISTDDLNLYYGEFYQFNLSSCIRQQNSLTAQFVSFSLSNLANIFYPPQFLQ